METIIAEEYSKLSQKYQMVVPKKVRRLLGLKSGDKVILRVKKVGRQKLVDFVPAPKSWAKYMRGLGKEVWKNVDVDKYISDLRDEWDR